MSTRTIVVTVFVADAAEIGRTADGMPNVASNTTQARLHLATPSEGDTWLLETWDDSGGEPRQTVDLVDGMDALAAGIARTIRDIADEKE